MPDRDLEALAAITREILRPECELGDLIPQAQALRDLFERRTLFRYAAGYALVAVEFVEQVPVFDGVLLYYTLLAFYGMFLTVGGHAHVCHGWLHKITHRLPPTACRRPKRQPCFSLLIFGSSKTM